MRERCCQYCGQELPEHRLGVRFTPIQGRIFDYVLTAGSAGISNDDLCDLLQSQNHVLCVHIHNINDLLADTGYQITGRTVRCLQKTGGRYHDSDAITPEQQKALGL